MRALSKSQFYNILPTFIRQKMTNCQNSGMIRSTMRHDPANCKVYFAKIRFFVFFLFAIRFYSQKYIIFAPCLKNDKKIQ